MIYEHTIDNTITHRQILFVTLLTVDTLMLYFTQ